MNPTFFSATTGCQRAFWAWLPSMLVLWTTSSVFGQLEIEFDYQYDTNGFFDVSERREALELAGRIVNRYTDTLSAVISEGDNTWSAFFSPPDGSSSQLLSNVPIPEGTLVVYAAGRRIPGRLAESLPVSALGHGDADWLELVETRGQQGATEDPVTDFGPLAGTVTFNHDVTEVDWHFGTEIDGISSRQQDFVTVAMHELLHLLGVGTSPSFADQVTFSGNFNGPQATAVSSATNPQLELDEFEHHFREGTESIWNGQTNEALMARAIFPGRRTPISRLDRAILRDIGWTEATAGDSNRDGVFNSTDLLLTFQRGLYQINKAAGWSDGDWNDNGFFESGDLIEALQTGTYEQPGFAAVAMVPEPNGGMLLVTGLLAYYCRRRR